MNLAAAFTAAASDIPPLFQHQRETIACHRTHPQGMNHSSCGVGKTRSYLEWLREHRDSGGGAALVLGSKTILQSAWAADAERFTPELKVSIATAENRRDGLKPGADIYLINHDAVRTLAKDPSMLPPGQVRRRILRAFVRRGRINAQTRKEMEAWEHGGGFSLDASVRIDADDRKGLERLLRTCARPSFAADRLEELDPPQCLIYRLPKPGLDGRTQMILSPLELIGRIAALVPPPRQHRQRYYGVLAPKSPLRPACDAAFATQY